MPRVTNNTFLMRRRKLRWIWFGRRWVWGEMTLSEQYDLHRYFHPTQEWQDEAALAWRDAKETTDPSLPQRAGRAYVKAIQLLERSQPPTPPRPVAYPHMEVEAEALNPALPRRARRQGWERHVTLRPILKEEIDLKQLAQVVRIMATERTRREQVAK